MGIVDRMRHLVAWLTRERAAPFYPLEQALLDELVARVPVPMRALLARQIASVNFVQRHQEDREVNLYAMVSGRPARPHDAAFPNRLEEVEFAVLKFRCAGSNAFRVSFVAVGGILFSLRFKPSPTSVLSERAVAVVAFESLADMMNAIVKTADRASLDRLPMCWANLCRDYGPCIAEGRDADPRLRPSPVVEGARLPDDYVSLMMEYRSIRSEIFEIYPQTELSPVLVNDAGYVPLAEVKTKGVLAITEGDDSGLLAFLPFDGSPPLRYTSSLCDGIEAVLKLRGAGG